MDRTENYDNRGYHKSSERGENFEVMLRRFFREVQQSGILTEIKKRRFLTKDVSRDKKRVSARRKAVIRRMKRGY